MILKALYDYYQRCKDLAPAGMEYKEIGFLIVIDKEGNFVRLEDRRIDKKNCQKFLVAKSVGRSGTKRVANLFWDNCTYLWGYSEKKGPGDEVCLQCFISKVKSVYKQVPGNKNVESVYRFYQHSLDEIQNAIIKDPLWETVRKDLTKNFSFLLDGETMIAAEDPEIIKVFNRPTDEADAGKVSHFSRCLITGNNEEAVETTTATSIPGRQAKAKLVSFQVNSGYDSYGKSKGFNAPISKSAEFAYTTALNRLTGKDSNNKFYIGSRTYVFWASSDNAASRKMESCLFALFGPKIEDDPNRYTDRVKEVFMDIYSGKLPTSSDDRFYILGLAPNAARIAVVYWSEQSVKEFAKHILRHFEDMEMVDTRPEEKRKPYSGLHAMLAAITLGGKSSDVQPNLPDAVIRSIMQELPYPEPLLAACIRRIRAEQEVYITRAAIIKAYLNRLNNNLQKIKVMLDQENANQGYVCGRLFATLERLQERANGIHSIRERYLNAASATPAAVFATLLNLSVHHAEKLDRGGQIFFENLKGEILQKVSSDGFPAHLDLNDQGRFFVGYYHQRQAFYTKKSQDDSLNENESTNE